MARGIQKFWMHYLLAVTFAVSQTAFAGGTAEGQALKIGLGATQIDNEKKLKEYKAALDKCKKEHPTDEKTACKDKQKKVDDIQAALDQNKIDQASTDKSNNAAAADKPPGNGGGGLGDAMQTIMPLATMGLMVCMMMKCLDKKKEKNDKALLPNGALDCSKSDAGQYADCDQYLIGACSGQSGGGVVSGNCAGFKNRFCAKNRTPNGVQQVELENGAVVQLNMGGNGAGQDSGYCQQAYASAYCTDAGYAQCPACMQQQAFDSETCKDKPALCIAQNSPAQMADAKKKCPGDPAIALYERAGGMNSTNGGTSTGAPVVVLPQSATQTLASVPGAAGGVSTGGSAGISTSSVSGGVSAGTAGSGVESSAAREGQTGYQGGGAVGGGVARSTFGNSREVASTGGSGAESVSGPASDVQGQFGPNLFAMGSQVIRNGCLQKKFNNCP